MGCIKADQHSSSSLQYSPGPFYQLIPPSLISYNIFISFPWTLQSVYSLFLISHNIFISFPWTLQSAYPPFIISYNIFISFPCTLQSAYPPLFNQLQQLYQFSLDPTNNNYSPFLISHNTYLSVFPPRNCSSTFK